MKKLASAIIMSFGKLRDGKAGGFWLASCQRGIEGNAIIAIRQDIPVEGAKTDRKSFLGNIR